MDHDEPLTLAVGFLFVEGSAALLTDSGALVDPFRLPLPPAAPPLIRWWEPTEERDGACWRVDWEPDFTLLGAGGATGKSCSAKPVTVRQQIIGVLDDNYRY